MGIDRGTKAEIREVWELWNAGRPSNIRTYSFIKPRNLAVIGKVAALWYWGRKPKSVDEVNGNYETLYYHDFDLQYMPLLCTQKDASVLYLVGNIDLTTGWLDNRKDFYNDEQTQLNKKVEFNEEPHGFARMGLLYHIDYYSVDGGRYVASWKDTESNPICMVDQDMNVLYVYGNFAIEKNKQIVATNDFRNTGWASRNSAPKPDDVHHVSVAIKDLVIDPELQPRSRLVTPARMQYLADHMDLMKLELTPIHITDGNRVVSGFHRVSALKTLVSEGRPVYKGGVLQSEPLTGDQIIPAVYVPPSFVKEAGIESNMGAMGYTAWEQAHLFQDAFQAGETDAQIGARFGNLTAKYVRERRQLLNLKFPAIINALADNELDADVIGKLEILGFYNFPEGLEGTLWQRIKPGAEKPISKEVLRNLCKLFRGREESLKETQSEASLFDLVDQVYDLESALEKLRRMGTALRADEKVYERMIQKVKGGEISHCSASQLETALKAVRYLLQHVSFTEEAQIKQTDFVPENMDKSILDDIANVASGKIKPESLMQRLIEAYATDIKELKAEEKAATAIEKAQLKEEQKSIKKHIRELEKHRKDLEEHGKRWMKKQQKTKGHLITPWTTLPRPLRALSATILEKPSTTMTIFGFEITKELSDQLYDEINDERADAIIQLIAPELQGETNQKARALIIEMAKRDVFISPNKFKSSLENPVSGQENPNPILDLLLDKPEPEPEVNPEPNKVESSNPDYIAEKPKRGPGRPRRVDLPKNGKRRSVNKRRRKHARH